jgi:hypothetical protein
MKDIGVIDLLYLTHREGGEGDEEKEHVSKENK